MGRRRKTLAAKVQMMGFCPDCDEVVDVVKVLIVGKIKQRLWQCKKCNHRPVDRSTVKADLQ